MMNNNLIFVIISTLVITNVSTTVRRISYHLNDNIVSLQGGSAINFILTFNLTASSSTFEIEAEQRLHDCCLAITNQRHLRIFINSNVNSYSNVNVYLNLHHPLSSIDLSGATHLIMQNTMKIDTLSLTMSDASNAQIKVEIMSKFQAYISGASKLIMNGFVQGDAHIKLSGVSLLDARSCPMNAVNVYTSGASTVYLSEQNADEVASRASEIEELNIKDLFKRLFIFHNAASKILDKSMKYLFIVFYMMYFLLF